jgi:hypothetical protein
VLTVGKRVDVEIRALVNVPSWRGDKSGDRKATPLTSLALVFNQSTCIPSPINDRIFFITYLYLM